MILPYFIRDMPHMKVLDLSLAFHHNVSSFLPISSLKSDIFCRPLSRHRFSDLRHFVQLHKKKMETKTKGETRLVDFVGRDKHATL